MSVPKTKCGEGQLVVVTKAEELAEHTIEICKNEKYFPKAGKVVKKIRPERISHERRKLRKLVQRAKEGLKSKSDVDKCYQSWKAHASYGDTHNLILQMDKFYKDLWR